MLEAADADAGLQLTFWEAARKDMDTQTAEIAESQEHLAARSAELPQLSAKHSELTEELSRVKSICAAESAVVDDLNSVVGDCELSIRRATGTG